MYYNSIKHALQDFVPLNEQQRHVKEYLAAEVVRLQSDVEAARVEASETREHAHRLADDTAEEERGMRDEMREIEWKAKEEGFRAGQVGGWY